MAKYYLHKQTIIIAIVCFVAVGSVSAYVYTQPTSASSGEVAIDNPASAADQVISTSTDWKKQFLSSESISGTELKSKTPSNEATDTPPTLTSQMSRDLFTKFIQLKQTGLDTNDQLVQDAIDQTLSSSFDSADQAKTYVLSDIIINNLTTPDAYRAYGNSIGSVLKNDMPEGDAPTIASDAYTKNDMTLLEKIDPLISAYQNSLKKILSTSVPSALVRNHLDLINGLSSLIFTSQKIRNIQADPMQSMVALSTYTNTENGIFASISSMKDSFKSMNVLFTNNEPGSFLYSITQ